MPRNFDPGDPFQNEFTNSPVDDNPLGSTGFAPAGSMRSSFFQEYKNKNNEKSQRADIQSLNGSINSLSSEINKLTRDYAERRSPMRASSRRDTVKTADFNRVIDSMSDFGESADKIVAASEGFSSSIDDFDRSSRGILSGLRSGVVGVSKASMRVGAAATIGSAKLGYRAGTAPIRATGRGISSGYHGLVDSEFGQAFGQDMSTTSSEIKKGIARGLLGANPVAAYLLSGYLRAGSKPFRMAGKGIASGAAKTRDLGIEAGYKAMEAGRSMNYKLQSFRENRRDLKEQKRLEKEYAKGSLSNSMVDMDEMPVSSMKQGSKRSKKIKLVSKTVSSAKPKYTEAGIPVNSGAFFEDIAEKSPLVQNFKTAFGEVFEEFKQGVYGGIGTKQGIRTMIGYSIPIFGLGYKSELPNIRKTGILAGIYRALALLYVHTRFASEESNKLMIQFMEMYMKVNNIEGTVSRPLPRSISQWIGEGLGQALFGKAAAKGIGGLMDMLKDHVFQKVNGTATTMPSSSESKRVDESLGATASSGGTISDKIKNVFGDFSLKSLRDPNTFVGGIYSSVRNAIIAAFSFLRVDLPKMLSSMFGGMSGIGKRSESDRGSEDALIENFFRKKGYDLNSPEIAEFIRLREMQKGGTDVDKRTMGSAAKNALKSVGLNRRSVKESGFKNKKTGIAGFFESVFHYMDTIFSTMQEKVMNFRKVLETDISDIDPEKMGFKEKFIKVYQHTVPDMFKKILFGEQERMLSGELQMDMTGKGGIVGLLVRVFRGLNWSIKRLVDSTEVFGKSLINFGTTVFGHTGEIWKDSEKGVFTKILDTVTKTVKDLLIVVVGLKDAASMLLKAVGNYMFEAQSSEFVKPMLMKKGMRDIGAGVSEKVGAGPFAELGAWIANKSLQMAMMSWDMSTNAFNAALGQAAGEEKLYGSIKFAGKEIKIKSVKEAFGDMQKQGRNPILNAVFGSIAGVQHLAMAAMEPIWKFLSGTFLEMQDIYKFFWGKDYNKEDLAKDLKATKNNLMTMISTIGIKSMDIVRIMNNEKTLGSDMVTDTGSGKTGVIQRDTYKGPVNAAEFRRVAGDIPEKAEGGYRPDGEPAIVGEQGPELAVGNWIIPFNKIAKWFGGRKVQSAEPTISSDEREFQSKVVGYLKDIVDLLSSGKGGSGKDGILKHLLHASLDVTKTMATFPFKVVSGLAQSGFLTSIADTIGGVIKTYIWAKYTLMIKGIELLTATVRTIGQTINTTLGFVLDGIREVGKGIRWMVTSIGSLLKGVKNFIFGIKDAILSPFRKLGELISKPFEKLKEWAGGIAGAINSKIHHMKGEYIVAIDKDNKPVFEKWPGMIVDKLSSIYSVVDELATFIMHTDEREDDERYDSERKKRMWDRLERMRKKLKPGEVLDENGNIISSSSSQMGGGGIGLKEIVMGTAAGQFATNLATMVAPYLIPAIGTLFAGFTMVAAPIIASKIFGGEQGTLVAGGIGSIAGAIIGGLLASPTGVGIPLGMGIGATIGSFVGSGIAFGTDKLRQWVEEKLGAQGATMATGGSIGLIAGAAIGGIIGSVVPGAGTAVGLGVGAALGGIIGGGLGFFWNKVQAAWDEMKLTFSEGGLFGMVKWFGSKISELLSFIIELPWKLMYNIPIVGPWIESLREGVKEKLSDAWAGFKMNAGEFATGTAYKIPIIGRFLGPTIEALTGSSSDVIKALRKESGVNEDSKYIDFLKNPKDFVLTLVDNIPWVGGYMKKTLATLIGNSSPDVSADLSNRVNKSNKGSYNLLSDEQKKQIHTEITKKRQEWASQGLSTQEINNRTMSERIRLQEEMFKAGNDSSVYSGASYKSGSNATFKPSISTEGASSAPSGDSRIGWVAIQVKKEYMKRGFSEQQAEAFARGAAAQLVQEVGWNSKKTIGDNNFFNIKDFKGNLGDLPPKSALDKVEGSYHPYASWSTPEKGIAGYVDFLMTNPRYEKAGVFNANTPEEYGAALQRAGFATDPQYASKIASIASSKKLNDLIAKEGGASSGPIMAEPVSPSGSGITLASQKAASSTPSLASTISNWWKGSSPETVAGKDTVAEMQVTEQDNREKLAASYNSKALNNTADQITSAVDRGAKQTVNAVNNNTVIVSSSSNSNVSAPQQQPNYSDSYDIASIILGPGRGMDGAYA